MPLATTNRTEYIGALTAACSNIFCNGDLGSDLLSLGWDLLPPGTKELEYDYGNGKVFEEQAGDGRR